MSAVTKNKGRGEDETPMMQQYHSIKQNHPESILFFRMGDFYEMFNEDAKVASRILEITLTARNKNKPIPMCGIPYHSSNGYICKLIKAGKTVAICEQVEDPKVAKGLVKREVVRVVTPGTVLDDNMLDPKSHQYLAAIHFDKTGFGLAALDITTGLFKVTELAGEQAASHLQDELEKLEPKEVLVPESILNENKLDWIQSHPLSSVEDWTFSHGQAYRSLTEHFKTTSLEGFGCESLTLAIASAGALIQYLNETQKSALQHIISLSTFNV